MDSRRNNEMERPHIQNGRKWGSVNVLETDPDAGEQENGDTVYNNLDT